MVSHQAIDTHLEEQLKLRDIRQIAMQKTIRMSEKNLPFMAAPLNAV